MNIPSTSEPISRHLATPCCGHGKTSGIGGVRDAFRARLPQDHVLATLMDEHARLLSVLDQLEDLARGLNSSAGMVLARIEALGRQLLGAEPHHAREEKVLFPALRARGIDGPPDVMEAEHHELRTLKHQVVDLAAKAAMGDAGATDQLRSAAQTLVGLLRGHIEKEDSILYPMAFAAIPEGEWANMRACCDEIGYCCHR
jgi:hemerythrin-like domain-containing protein